jgi:hypothetical protein
MWAMSESELNKKSQDLINLNVLNLSIKKIKSEKYYLPLLFFKDNMGRRSASRDTRR